MTQDPGGASDLVGQRLGQYELESFLGGGFFGQVYRARHVALALPRAVKVMHSATGAQPAFRARFLHEAQTTASLSHPRPHPNIVAVLDYGVEGNIQYLVMEYVDSVTLADYLDRVPVAERSGDATLRQCVADIASALDYAHERGVIHRDIKPANILIRNESGRALLTDFGIAWVQQDLQLTQAEQSVGTYPYMSPEQCESSENLTPASDIYGFTAMLYEIASGSPPFGRGLAAVAGHLGRPMPPIPSTGPHSAELNAVLAKGLAKAAQDRYSSAGALAAAFLTAFPGAAEATTSSTSTRPAAPPRPPPTPAPRDIPSPWRRPWQVVRTHRVLSGAIALGVLVAVLAAAVVAALAAIHPTPAPQPTPPPALPEPVRGSVGTPMRLDGLQLTVLDVGSVSLSPTGDRLISVTVMYSDVGRTAVSVSPYDWVVLDSQNATYSTVDQGTAGVPQTELQPQHSVREIVQFAVPGDAHGLVLRYNAETGYQTAAVNLG